MSSTLHGEKGDGRQEEAQYMLSNINTKKEVGKHHMIKL